MTILNESHLTIDTTTPQLTIGEIQISADRRTAKGAEPLPDAERIRRVVLPAGYWTGVSCTLNSQHSQALTDTLHTALKDLANARLRDYLTEEPLARTVPLSDYTVPALLAWNSLTAASRGALTVDRDEVIAWFKTSQLFTQFAKAPAVQQMLEQRCAALAANNHGLKTVEDASGLIAMLAGDSESPIAIEMISRLNSIVQQLSAKVSRVPTLAELAAQAATAGL
jgi:hypothetical protein